MDYVLLLLDWILPHQKDSQWEKSLMISKLMTELCKNNVHEDASESNYILCKHKYISLCQYIFKIEIADSRLFWNW